jgi:hypothetical protein
MRLACGILGSVLVEEERGQTSDQLAATAADEEPGLAVIAVAEIFADDSPAGDSPVICGSHRRHTGG